MTNDKIVFYFKFDLEDETEKNLGFLITKVDLIKNGFSNFDSFVEDAIFPEAERLEYKYGVHDWSTSPKDNINAIGYTTYETPENEIPKLLKEWQDVFYKYLPEALVSNIIEVEGRNDAQILKYLEDKLG
jgi:hypothetical protein